MTTSTAKKVKLSNGNELPAEMESLGSSNADLLWRHVNPESTQMWAFMKQMNQKHGLTMKNWQDLYQWSIDDVGLFWLEVWKFVGVVAGKEPDEVS